MKFKTLLLFTLFHSLLFCNNPKQTDEFYLTLPDGWIQIPRQAVEFLTKELSYPEKISYYENYDYLYQLKSSDTLFTLPYILIQVSNNGRPDKSDFSNTKNMRLDKATGYLWSEKDSTINVIIPTEKGTLNIYCVSSLIDSRHYLPIYKQVVKSIILNHKLLYRDDFVNNTPIIRDIVKKENQSKVAFFAILFGVLAIRIYRKKVANK